MSAFQNGLPASRVHEGLKKALADLRLAEKNAVLWFAEILRRKLYHELGYSSIHMYAGKALEFSRSKTYHFIELAQSIDRLPELRASVTAGEIPWTKAVCVARVATPKSENRWIEEARTSGRRELERKVKQSRAMTRSTTDSSQRELLAGAESLPPALVSLGLKFDADQYARLQGLLEDIRKRGDKRSREEIFLEALGMLADESEKSSRLDKSTAVESDEGRHASTPTRQVIIYKCEQCGGAKYPDGRPVTAAELGASECDARVLETGKRNRSTLPPAMRRAVLARDRHRYRVKGCGSTRYLEVHHLKPRRAGGGNEAGNLVTLCSACHRLAHEKDLDGLIKGP